MVTEYKIICDICGKDASEFQITDESKKITFIIKPSDFDEAGNETSKPKEIKITDLCLECQNKIGSLLKTLKVEANYWVVQGEK